MTAALRQKADVGSVMMALAAFSLLQARVRTTLLGPRLNGA